VYSSESDIPPAEKKHLFVHSFQKINPDGDKATIDFESKYIEEGGSQWVNYADTAAEDADIDSELINYDYKNNLRYNSYLGKINRARNDQLEEEQEKLKEVARAEPDNIQAIIDQCAAFSLHDQVHPSGDLCRCVCNVRRPVFQEQNKRPPKAWQKDNAHQVLDGRCRQYHGKQIQFCY